MRLRHTLTLVIILAALWLMLSGYFKPLLLGFGVASVALVTWVAVRMQLVDEEGQPIQLSWRVIAYWGYLLGEIVKANVDVIRRVLDPRLPISPRVVRLPISQRTDVGRVLYANSITLTPGTVSLEVQDDYIDVHALSAEGAEGLQSGDMDRRVTRVERGQ